MVQNDFTSLEKEIKISLHSRDLHRKASVIYNNPDLFSEVKRAWAVWMTASMSFGSMLDGSFGYDIAKSTTSKKIHNKRASFSEDYAIRLQQVQIECTDALRIIGSRDNANAFFYCDPPYYNADMGHYDGYTIEDFEALLTKLSKIKGKFLLSSYPSEILKAFVKKYGWFQQQLLMDVTVGRNNAGKYKKKIEVLTANYPLNGN